MGTLADLKARIAAEIDRDDLDAQIATAITQSIEHYASRRFWFNEDERTTVTVSGNEYAAVPTGLRVADDNGAFVTVGAAKYALKKLSSTEIADALNAGGGRGQPMAFAIVGDRMRFYPKPNAAYTITVSGTYDLAALADDAASNAWTGTGQDLIAARARSVLYRDVMGDPDAEARANYAKGEAKGRLIAETTRRLSRGRMRPSW